MQSTLKYILNPAGFVYSIIMLVRNAFFDIGIFRTKKLPVPVVSIGNLTAGGTGKTPATAHIARMLQSEGYKVGIISRGYKRKTRGYYLVSDGNRVIADAKNGGDEPVMLAHLIPGMVVAVHEKRYSGARNLINDFGVEVIIMDDGFQHRMLHRDLDVVLIDGSRMNHLEAHLPAGRLRESLHSLRRSHIVILTKCDDKKKLESIEKMISRYAGVPVIKANLEPEVCIDVVRNIEVPLKNVVTKKAYLFSGIAHPEGFRRTVIGAGFTVCGMLKYPDHYSFRDGDILLIFDEAKRSGADILITTEKDAIRIHPYKHLFNENLPLYALRVIFTPAVEDNRVLEKYLYRMMNKHKRSVTIN